MYHYLLDAGGAGLIYIGVLMLLLFLVCAVVLEAVVMALLKYNLGKKAFRDSALVNLASVVVGLICILASEDLFHLNNWSGYAAFFGVTLVVEGVVLYLLNKTKPLSKTIMVCLVMNVVTYILLYLIGGGF